jgi:HD-like signal output (HDOD) protein
VDLQSLCLRISRSENLPVLPTIVVQILKLYEDPNISSRKLEQLIEQDAAMSAKIIRIAGSSMYGMKSVTTINRALSVLGMNTLRSIAISLGYQQILAGGRSESHFDRFAFWRHCLAVGIGSRELMRNVSPVHAEETYIAGLMHDIGVLALEKFANNHLAIAVDQATRRQMPLYQVEMELNGFSHCDVGGHLAEKWSMTKRMNNAIKFHENPDEDQETRDSTAVVAAANYIAYQCGYPSMPGIPGGEEGELYLNQLGLPESTVENVKNRVIFEITEADGQVGSSRAA